MCNIFNLELKKWCWRSFGFVLALVLGMCYIGSARADVCFLPSGDCLSDTNLSAPQDYRGEDCSTYIATYRQQHLEYAEDCVTCGGREYCKCGSDRRLVGNECLCQDSDKIIKNGSCTACPSNKEKASETTCKCKSIYDHTPVTNEVCTDSCSNVAEASFDAALAASPRYYASHSTAQAMAAQATNSLSSNSQASSGAALSQMSQSQAAASSAVYGTFGSGTQAAMGAHQGTSLILYNKSSCGCKSGYEYVGDQCLAECDSSKGLARSGTECVCSDSKKEWSNTENKCVCKPEFNPDGNGGCVSAGCENPHQVRVNGECKCDTDSGYYDSIDICRLYLPSTQAYNLNWWDLLQQKATNAVYQVAQCLMPVKAAYAEQQINTMSGTENYAGNLNGGVGELDSGLPVYGGGASGGTTGGGLGNSDTPNQGTDGNGYFRPSTDTNNDNHLDEGIEARCRKYCAGSTAYSSCMANCMGYELNDEDLQGTTVGIDGEYEGPVGGGSGSVPTVTYSCEPDTLGTCWSVQKHCDNSQYLYDDEDECNTTTNSSCIKGSDGCFSPVCNQVQNQYEIERDCDEDWHDVWHCAQNTSTGCFYPICDYQSDYYDDEQDCEYYGTEYTAHCALVPQTVGTGIECYEPICDPAIDQYDDEQDCWHFGTNEEGVCELKQISHYKSCYVPKDQEVGLVTVMCHDEVWDYGQDYSLGCLASWGDIYDSNNQLVYTWQGYLGREGTELNAGIYKLVYKNLVRHGNGFYGFTGLVEFDGQRYECGYTSSEGYLRELKCTRKCLCWDQNSGSYSGNIIDCYYDYEITFKHDHFGEEILFYPYTGDVFHDGTWSSFRNERGSWGTKSRFSSSNGTCTATYTAGWSNN